jgi:hypothetical protein
MNMPKTIARKAKTRRVSIASSGRAGGAMVAFMVVVAVAMAVGSLI